MNDFSEKLKQTDSSLWNTIPTPKGYEVQEVSPVDNPKFLRVFDSNDNKVFTIDTLGSWTEYTYDQNNKIIYSKESNGHQWECTYDKNGNRTSYKDNNNFSFECSYDQNNNLIKLNQSDGFWFEKAFDEHNKILFEKNSLGIDNEFVYKDSSTKATRVEKGEIQSQYMQEFHKNSFLNNYEKSGENLHYFSMAAAHPSRYGLDTVVFWEGNQMIFKDTPPWKVSELISGSIPIIDKKPSKFIIKPTTPFHSEIMESGGIKLLSDFYYKVMNGGMDKFVADGCSDTIESLYKVLESVGLNKLEEQLKNTEISIISDYYSEHNGDTIDNPDAGSEDPDNQGYDIEGNELEVQDPNGFEDFPEYEYFNLSEFSTELHSHDFFVASYISWDSISPNIERILKEYEGYISPSSSKVYDAAFSR